MYPVSKVLEVVNQWNKIHIFLLAIYTFILTWKMSLLSRNFGLTEFQQNGGTTKELVHSLSLFFVCFCFSASHSTSHQERPVGHGCGHSSPTALPHLHKQQLLKHSLGLEIHLLVTQFTLRRRELGRGHCSSWKKVQGYLVNKLNEPRDLESNLQGAYKVVFSPWTHRPLFTWGIE